MTLAEALAHVELEAGKTYQTLVDDKLIQVRVIDAANLPTGERLGAADGMLDCWFDTPQLATTRLLKPGEFLRHMYPQPVRITDDDLTPGDLT